MIAKKRNRLFTSGEYLDRFPGVSLRS